MKTTLYRPVGIHELGKIAKSGLKTFPPRLPEQPIFYPVTNLEYAIQIARDWNTKDVNSGYCGFVTSFIIDSNYINQYKVMQVGANIHKEYWIPAEELNEFNSKIIGLIQIIDSFYGGDYKGQVFDFNNKPIDVQIDYLKNLFCT